jgi:alkanesulfonate monooxygenase SsuD/methylene tetrahydromethanopterin reductase-like flavin-dependent oxidoreductase (luciferase family)
MNAGSGVRVGLTLPSFQSDPERVLAVAKAAEEAGLDGVFAFDHLFRARGDAAEGERRPALELLTMTAAVAAATRRIMVGTLVARATLRPPAMLRAAFDTLERIAPGRIIAGLGAGDDDSLAEDTAFGVLPGDPIPGRAPHPAVPRPDPAPAPGGSAPGGSAPGGSAPGGSAPGGSAPGGSARGGSAPGGSAPGGSAPGERQPRGQAPIEPGRYRLARLEATVDAVSGRGYPLWLAGVTPAAIRLAATRADGWNLWGGTADQFAVAAGRVRDELLAAGRNPAGFALTWGGLAVLGADPEEARAKSDRLGGDRPGIVRGTPSDVADQIAAYAAAGAAWVILGPVDSSDPSNAAVLGDALKILSSRRP